MPNLAGLLRRFTGGAGVPLLASLTAGAVVLAAAAVIGTREPGGTAAGPLARQAGPDPREDVVQGIEGVDPTEAEGTAGPDPQTTPQGGPAQPQPTGAQPPAAAPGGGELPSQPGATRTGVFGDHFRWGVHAPLTLNGQPLNIAEDFIIGLKGYVVYLNRQGGIHGRKIQLHLADDKYTTRGGREARDRLVTELRPFVLSGTLGVDQVKILADGARAAGIPYLASGGPEPEWQGVGMYQVSSNYDQYMDILVNYICSRHGREYVGEEIRLGTTTLNSEYILPVENRFVQKLQAQGCVAPVEANARGRIRKPDEQAEYSAQIIRLRQSYGGLGANLIVPLQDPISTSRQVHQMRATYPTYRPKWTFSNFVHDAETTLALMGGEWTGVRGLSGACHWLSETAGNPAQCMRMGEARRRWVSLGRVDFRREGNVDGCNGTPCEYDFSESTWQSQDAQGGSAAYQLVQFMYGAMQSAGPDPTREKFVAALQAYDRYSDLITGPITFRGSNNFMRGAFGSVIVEGQSNLRYRQVTDITPGIVEGF